MKKRASVIAASVLLFFTGMLWCSCKREDVAKDQPSTFATINGIVRDLDNGEPLSDVLLTLSPGGLNAYSDDVGAFKFEEVEALQYMLMAQKNGYKANRKIFSVEVGQTLTVNMTISKQ